jgi:3-oxoacyl-[acyl-carrier-protein] synthase II
MSQNDRRRVVITGVGVVSPIGIGEEIFWRALTEGRTNIVTLEGILDTEGLACKIASVVSGYNPSDYFDPKDQKRLAKFVQFASIAAAEAVKSSGLNIEAENPWRIGSFIGCGIGGIGEMEEQILVMASKGARRVSPLLIPKIIGNMACGQVAIDLGIKGPNAALTTACASGAHALGESMRSIQNNAADIMVSGGAESAMCRIALAGFSNMKALSFRNDDPLKASRPFDAERDGFVMGEGAGILILEELEHAKARGASIMCELAGYGATDDAFHITAPDADGAGGAMAMRLAVEDAGAAPENVQYVNAHGTSTPLNDKIETLAIKTVFNSHARSLAISSNKSMIGHLLGAAAAVEAIACVKTIQNSVIPPTINYENPDPDCDLDYVPNEAREAEVNMAISNSLGFGGHNATLAFRKFIG